MQMKQAARAADSAGAFIVSNLPVISTEAAVPSTLLVLIFNFYFGLLILTASLRKFTPKRE